MWHVLGANGGTSSIAVPGEARADRDQASDRPIPCRRRACLAVGSDMQENDTRQGIVLFSKQE